jgi:serine/alanine adding enzyme
VSGDWLDLEGYRRAWARLGDGDPYSRPEYLAAAAHVDGGEPAAYADGALVYPLLVRPLGDGRCDLTSAYGFGGPWGTSPGWRGRFRSACRARGVVSEFVRFHPLRRNERRAGDDLEVVHVQDMITVEVGRADEALVAQMASQGRRNLARARRAGVEVRPSSDMAAFQERYLGAMRRLGAAPFYHFPPAYFGALERLGDALVLLDGGEAAALYLCGAGAMHYHLGATTEEGRRAGAATMVHFEAMRRARDAGLRLLHLGGGLRAGDALHRFKATLGGGRAPYHVGRAVHDRDAYEALCTAAGVPADGDYFPAYRVPAARGS